jgi:hypothetical protein
MNGEEGRPYVPIGGPLNICNTCPVKHYDNCPDCYGFGEKPARINGRDTRVPVRAAEAKTVVLWLACRTCNSTPAGIPVRAES